MGRLGRALAATTYALALARVSAPKVRNSHVTRAHREAPGIAPCTACGYNGLGDMGWDYVSDAQTGTVYARCKRCGAHALSSPGGFVDWRVGMMLDTNAAVGSAWTQMPSARYMPEVSKLTKGRP